MTVEVSMSSQVTASVDVDMVFYWIKSRTDIPSLCCHWLVRLASALDWSDEAPLASQRWFHGPLEREKVCVI